jgi:mono/diheme cytochrome c family protein
MHSAVAPRETVTFQFRTAVPTLMSSMTRRTFMRNSRLFSIALATTVSASVVSFAARAAEPDKKTVRTWKAKCASCHGAEGKGDTDKAKEMGMADMTTDAWQKQFTDAQIKDATLKGLKRDKNGKSQEMQGFADKLKPEEVDALVGYVRSLKK